MSDEHGQAKLSPELCKVLDLSGDRIVELEADVTRLRAENERLEKLGAQSMRDVSEMHDALNVAVREATAMREQVERLEKDAARLSGWSFEPSTKHGIRYMTIKAPNGYVAHVASHALNPENVLYMLGAALAQAQEGKTFAPNKGCETPDTCRKAGFCDDTWHCAYSQEGKT